MIGTVPWASDLASVVAAHGARTAIMNADGTETSFAELASRAARLAHRLRDKGISFGTPVATAFRNGVPAVVAATGLRLAGVADAALNPAMTDAECAYATKLSGARLVITTPELAPAFAALGCDTLTLDDGHGSLDRLPPVPADAWGRIGFTSGTTGQPKAIVTTHGARWIGNLLQRASLTISPAPGDRILLMTPFVHGAGLLAQAFHDGGAAIVLLDGANSGVATVLLEDAGISAMFAPPTVLAKIVAAMGDRQATRLRLILTGTAPLLPPLYTAAREKFGPIVRLTYGKSEINNPIAALAPAECDSYFAETPDPERGVCVGYPGAGVEIELRDDTGAIVARGEVGEAHLRGRHMSCGHISPDGVFHALPADGFHASGDFGRFDERGRLHLVGRVADVIKSGGYKIHPDEIERALAHTAQAVAITTLPSAYWGEVIVAVAEGADDGWPARARDALAGLSRAKHPRAFLAWPELPRNAQGKIMRRSIRAKLLATHRLIDGAYPTLEPIDDV